MASYSDVYNYQVAFGPSGDVQTVAAVQRVSRAAKQAADDAKAAAREQARAAREAAREQAEAARQAAKAARDAARQQVEAARQQAREARQAAKEQAEAARQVAREARDAARQQAQAAREAARAARESAREQMKADREAVASAQAAAKAQAAADRQAAQSAQAAAQARQNVVGGVAMQIGSLADDIQAGTRGIQNNVAGIIAAMGGYTPAAQLAAGASSILLGVFRDQIDAGLAWAGVLDSNLVKGLENTKEKTDELAVSAGLLDKALDQQAKAVDNWAASLAAVSDRISNVSVDKALEAVARQTRPLGNEIDALAAKIGKAEEAAQLARDAMGGLGGEGAAQAAAAAADEVARLQGELSALLAESEKRTKDTVKSLKDGLDAGGDAAKGVIDQIAAVRGEGDGLVKALRDAALGTDRLKKEQEELADAILEGERKIADAQRARWEAGEKARQEEAQGILDLIRLEEERAQMERARRLERAQQQAREALDADARRAVEAFGPGLQGRIANELQGRVLGGMAPGRAGEQVVFQLMRLLERMGVGPGAAGAAANQLVDEQLGAVQAQVDANNANFMFGREMLQGMTLMQQLWMQQRQEMLQMMREAQRLRERAERDARRWAPMWRLQGNNAAGRF